MKREILFRAQNLSGNWVEGLPFYSYGLGEWSITCSNGWAPSYSNPDEGETTLYIEIKPETIGQFTGLTDKNGKKIFEGDILKCDPFTKLFWISFGESEKWGACFCAQSSNSIYFLSKSWTILSEVIGNIHDNPELLK